MPKYTVTLTFEVEEQDAQHAAAFFLEELFQGPSWGDKKLEVSSDHGDDLLTFNEWDIDKAFYSAFK